MHRSTEQKRTHRPREQTGGCQGGVGWMGSLGLADPNLQVDKQQGPTEEHRELYSLSWCHKRRKHSPKGGQVKSHLQGVSNVGAVSESNRQMIQKSRKTQTPVGQPSHCTAPPWVRWQHILWL